MDTRFSHLHLCLISIGALAKDLPLGDAATPPKGGFCQQLFKFFTILFGFANCVFVKSKLKISPDLLTEDDSHLSPNVLWCNKFVKL